MMTYRKEEEKYKKQLKLKINFTIFLTTNLFTWKVVLIFVSWIMLNSETYGSLGKIKSSF